MTIEIDAPWGSRQQQWFGAGTVFTIHDTMWEVVAVTSTDDGRTRLITKPHVPLSRA